MFTIQDIIAVEIPALHLHDNAATAINIMEEFNIEHLALVDDQKQYLGIVSYDHLTNMPESATMSTLLQAPILKAAAREFHHPYRAARLMGEYNLTTVPVINEQQALLGVVNPQNLLNFLIKNTGLVQPGGIVMLEVKPFSYSLSEIARICESNDVLILNVQIIDFPENDSLIVMLKTNTKDLKSVLATFERYEYNATIIDGEMQMNDNAKERWDILMRYLNI